jgi:hypothetical protein
MWLHGLRVQIGGRCLLVCSDSWSGMWDVYPHLGRKDVLTRGRGGSAGSGRSVGYSENGQKRSRGVALRHRRDGAAASAGVDGSLSLRPLGPLPYFTVAAPIGFRAARVSKRRN